MGLPEPPQNHPKENNLGGITRACARAHAQDPPSASLIDDQLIEDQREASAPISAGTIIAKAPPPCSPPAPHQGVELPGWDAARQDAYELTQERRRIEARPRGQRLRNGQYRVKPAIEQKRPASYGPLRRNPQTGAIEGVNGAGAEYLAHLAEEFPGIRIKRVLTLASGECDRYTTDDAIVAAVRKWAQRDADDLRKERLAMNGRLPTMRPGR